MSWQDMSENDRVEELSSNKTRALAALLVSSSMPEAAEAAGVSERTIRRWLSEDAVFRDEYRRQRRAMIDSTVGFLQSAMSNAIVALNEAVLHGAPNNRIRAALGLLDHGLRATKLSHIELVELEELLPQLRELLDQQALEKQKTRGNTWVG